MENTLSACISTPRLRLVVLAAVLSCVPGFAFSDDTAAARPVNPYSGKPEFVTEGGSLLNQYCSHCHGQWAEQGERPRDLRRLRIRYGDDAIVTFWTTVNNGRILKGMPIWKGVLTDDVLWKIYTFLETVQADD